LPTIVEIVTASVLQSEIARARNLDGTNLVLYGAARPKPTGEKPA
jgi:hypothetical protein